MLNVKRSIFIGLGKNGVQMLLKTAALLGNAVPAETRLVQYVAIDYEERLESAGLEGQKITRIALQPASASQFDETDRARLAAWLPVPVDEALETLATGESKNRSNEAGEFIQVFEAENSASSRRWFGRLSFYQNISTVRNALNRVSKSLYKPENLELAGRAKLALQDDRRLQVIILADLSEPLAGGALLDLAYLLQNELELEILRPFNQLLTLAAVLTLPYNNLQQASVAENNTFKTISLHDEKVLARQSGTRNAQAYATLDELSRYLSGATYNMTYGDGSRVVSNNQPPFNGYCYLASAQNEAGAELAGPDKVHELVAQWLQSVTLGNLPPLPPVNDPAAPGFAAFGQHSLVLPVEELSRYFSNRWCHATLTALLATPDPKNSPTFDELVPYTFEALTQQWLQSKTTRPQLHEDVLQKMPSNPLAAEQFLLSQTANQTEIAIPAFEQQLFADADAMVAQFEQKVLATTRDLLVQPDRPLQKAQQFTAACHAEIENTVRQAQVVTQQLEAAMAATLSQINQMRPAFLTALYGRPGWLAIASLVGFSLLPLLTFSASSVLMAWSLALAGGLGGILLLAWLWDGANKTCLQGWQLYRQVVDLAGRRVMARAAARFAEAALRVANDAQGEVAILQQKLAGLAAEYETNQQQDPALQAALEPRSGESSTPLLRLDQLDQLYRRVAGSAASELAAVAAELFGWRNLADADIRDRLQLYANQTLAQLRGLNAGTVLVEMSAEQRVFLLRKSLLLAQPYWRYQMTARAAAHPQLLVFASPGLEQEPALREAEFIAPFDAYRVIVLSTRVGVPLACLPQIAVLQQYYTELTEDEPALQAHLYSDQQFLLPRLLLNRPATGTLPVG